MDLLRSFFFIIITLFFVHVPTSVLCIDDKYEKCVAPFQCGNMDFRYPFWGGDRSEYCGYPGFKVDCNSGVPEITIANRIYRVLKIDSPSKIVSVAIQDYWDNNCPKNPGNSPLNFTIFDYSPDTQNITLYYDCPVSSPNEIPAYRFNCSPDDTNANTANYFLIPNTDITSVFGEYLGSCDNNVQVSVLGSTIQSIERDPISANLTQVVRDGFGLQWYANNSLCDSCQQSNGVCGHDSDNSEFVCYCTDQPHPYICPNKGSSFGKRRMLTLSLGIAAGVVGILIILSIFLIRGLGKNSIFHWFDKFSKNKTENSQNMEAFVRNFGSLAPTRYNYSNVKKMTESFSHKLGQGGYGDVYKGKLPDGRLVAVKFLKESKGNGEEFTNEVASISRTSHVNIVNLLGFCYERNKIALIYEFMPNGSLDKFIYDQESSTTKSSLEWKTMYQIAGGIARGLEYLHRGCNTRIVHFDIKPHNILLDEDFCPKISDFGLAKLCKKKESIISMLGARGTIGYIAPEVFCRTFGEASHRSDVYSYGMMILEMVGGRKNIDVRVSHTSEIYFPNWIYKQLEPSNDFELRCAITEEEKELAKKMVLVSLWCIQTFPSDRPSMTKVVEMLEGGLECIQVPPKPSLASQTRSPQHFSQIASSSSSA
ncbi:hypothetical protein Dsin_012258 [Dipteronia sinensis]|uniref:non-specific serine/threonine protein kinase n=1 Tax=Dipteronia sinensis TaxID=43782 RepID=A0AAE0E7S6_9ROSI|nr:hypothetical protein Dsin_012258 [Dipteronia sinensis]